MRILKLAQNLGQLCEFRVCGARRLSYTGRAGLLAGTAGQAPGPQHSTRRAPLVALEWEGVAGARGETGFIPMSSSAAPMSASQSSRRCLAVGGSATPTQAPRLYMPRYIWG